MKLDELKEKLNQAKDHLEAELKTIRTGRATPSLVENIEVEVYSSNLQIKELANISTDGTTITIIPWDKSNIDAITKAVRNSEMGFTPNNDEEKVVINVPPLSQERRREFVKLVGEKMEEAKITVRNIRQNALKALDDQKEGGIISEDEWTREKKGVEEEIKSANDEIIKIGDQKKELLMRV